MEEERRIRKEGRGEGEKRRGGDEEEPRRGKEERMRGWGGGAVFLAMQVLEIPAARRPRVPASLI